MTSEEVFMYSRAYRLYFSSNSYDFIKYKGQIKTPPLIQQKERQFYYRLATKLNDEEIHATFLTTHFFKPTAFITDVCSPESIQAGVAFASRAENGAQGLANHLYTVYKQFQTEDIEAWLYGAWMGNKRASMPNCIGQLITKDLSIELAVLLLMIPHSDLGYDWVKYWEHRDPTKASFGVHPWITRLQKADQLIRLTRGDWRQLSFKYSEAFWKRFDCAPPVDVIEHTLC